MRETTVFQLITFEAFRQYVSDRHPLKDDHPSTPIFVITLPKGRTQNLMIHEVKDLQGQAYLRMVSFIALAEKIDPASCLRFNASFPGGHLVLDRLGGDEMIAMCNTQLLGAVTAGWLDASIQRVCAAADALERKLFAKDDL